MPESSQNVEGGVWEPFPSHGWPMGCTSKSGVMLLALLLIIVLATGAKSQETRNQPASGSPPGQGTSSSPKPKQKPSLLDATRVSTEEAAKSAAQQRSKKAPSGETAQSSSDSSVTEFHPARPDSAPSGGTAVTTTNESNKSGAKRVHGTVYGSTTPGGSGDRRGGAAVGAASKSDKTHVYVQTEHSRTDTPH